VTALLYGWQDVMRRAGWVITNVAPFGRAGLTMKLVSNGRPGSVIITQSEWPSLPYGDGERSILATEILHASVAFTDSDPTYADLVVLHRAVFGRRRYSYQCFTPEATHVNIHEHALHLWGRADGQPMMPDFGAELGSI
jgi:hypothetical protein